MTHEDEITNRPHPAADINNLLLPDHKPAQPLSQSRSNLSVHSYLPDLDNHPGCHGDQDDADDGEAGFRASGKGFRWLLVACSFGVFTLSSITQITFGVFITELEEIFGLSHAMIGVIGSFRLSLASMGGGCALYNTYRIYSHYASEYASRI